MTANVSEWLPLGVAAREPLRAKIAAAVSAWSDTWFADAGLVVSRVAPCPSAPGSDWRVLRGALAVRRSESAAARLLDWALDADVARLSASCADHRLVQAFERRLMEDLVLKVEDALGIEGQFLPEPQVTAEPFGRLGGLAIEVVDGNGDAALSLAAPLEALLPACRSTLPQAVRRPARLTPLATALGEVPVTIEAVLGASSVTLIELQGLELGDVIVLDTALEEPAALSLSGSSRNFANAKLTEIDGEMALVLQV